MLNILANALPVKNPQREARGQLRIAQLELLEAEAALEHAQALVSKLKNRTKRLASQVDADEAAARRSAVNMPDHVVRTL
jgi:beta-phosphoglucomutase-like phosphatase (HAD superfamily)